jgi:hypothetical protein
VGDSLSDQEKRDVLRNLKRDHDCNWGVDRETLSAEVERVASKK